MGTQNALVPGAGDFECNRLPCEGRSGSREFCVFLLRQRFISRRVAAVAMLPSALSRSDLFARCRLGVLVSAGAAICLATCRSLKSGTWPRRLTQSPELGFGFLFFRFRERF